MSKSPVAYAELPHAQHAFDIFSSPRASVCGGRGAVFVLGVRDKSARARLSLVAGASYLSPARVSLGLERHARVASWLERHAGVTPGVDRRAALNCRSLRFMRRCRDGGAIHRQ